MSELRFDNRVAIVTGAGAGLGREYALLLASRGAKVVVNDLGGGFDGEGQSQKAADIVVDEIRKAGGTAVADYNSVVDGDKVVATAINAFGRIDILINNAGILRDRSLAKISEQDWNLVQDVHLKGSFKTTQAAWPYFKKQKYGRIVMTTSGSGLYGNFGQANYSAAKMGLVGLTNTIAKEGQASNIHCNVITPTAASRMTKNIMPEVVFNQLQPGLIAPVVAFLVHESNQDNGIIIESAAGFATKTHLVRGKGALLRTKMDEGVTLEAVRDRWSKITDLSSAIHLDSNAAATVILGKHLESLESGDALKYPVRDDYTFSKRDLIIYALGVGTPLSDPENLKFLYENHPDFIGLPTYFVLPALILSMESSLISNSLKNVTLLQILHGEQYLEVFEELPIGGTVSTKGRVIDTLDKGSGAVIIGEFLTTDENGTLLAKNQITTFAVGAGGFGGKKTPSSDAILPVSPPKRNPEKAVSFKVPTDLAAIYRLSGDLNPLHIDPGFSTLAGYKVPILHGLATLGISVRIILETYANRDPRLFKAVKVRFSNVVTPGQTLKVEMWREKLRIHFRTIIVETKKEAISGAYVDLKDVTERTLKL